MPDIFLLLQLLSHLSPGLAGACGSGCAHRSQCLAPLLVFSPPPPLKYCYYNTTSSNNGHGKGSHSVLQFDFLTELFDWQSVPWSSFAGVEM